MTTIRAAEPRDLDEILRLNNDAVPAVSVSDRDRMAALLELATLSWVVDASGDGAEAGELGGFVLLFEPGTMYDSPNYAWFTERFERFLYVDRIVVAPAARGEGLGGRLYAEVIAEAERRGCERVTAEVNVEPPNPGSSRFHRRIGFDAVGTQSLGPDYIVEMLARPVS